MIHSTVLYLYGVFGAPVVFTNHRCSCTDLYRTGEGKTDLNGDVKVSREGGRPRLTGQRGSRILRSPEVGHYNLFYLSENGHRRRKSNVYIDWKESEFNEYFRVTETLRLDQPFLFV